MNSFFINTVGYGLFSFFSYFTTFPKNLFIHANKNSNMALTEIGLGLMINQRIFWISNAGILVTYFINNSVKNKIFFSLAYTGIQIFLFYKTIYWYKLLKENLNK